MKGFLLWHMLGKDSGFEYCAAMARNTVTQSRAWRCVFSWLDETVPHYALVWTQPSPYEPVGLYLAFADDADAVFAALGHPELSTMVEVPADCREPKPSSDWSSSDDP